MRFKEVADVVNFKLSDGRNEDIVNVDEKEGAIFMFKDAQIYGKWFKSHRFKD